MSGACDPAPLPALHFLTTSRISFLALPCRYWASKGPQMTLYVPGPVLWQGENEVVLLELELGENAAVRAGKAQGGLLTPYGALLKYGDPRN